MSIMYAQMGLAVGQSLFNYQSAKIQTRLEEANRQYRNTMSALSAAGSMNAITLNELNVRDVQITRESPSYRIG